MPIPRNIYSQNIKVDDAAYNPSLSRNIHVHLHLLHTAAGEVQKLFHWFPIKIISTCESANQVLGLVWSYSRREMELQILKFKET